MRARGLWSEVNADLGAIIYCLISITNFTAVGPKHFIIIKQGLISNHDTNLLWSIIKQLI